jgi:hypothetical protein
VPGSNRSGPECGEKVYSRRLIIDSAMARKMTDTAALTGKFRIFPGAMPFAGPA